MMKRIWDIEDLIETEVKAMLEASQILGEQ